MTASGASLILSPDALRSYGLFACEPPDTLYHYTNLDGAAGILSSKSLWLTKFTYLNDTTELKHVVKMFRELVDQRVEGMANSQKREFLENVAEQLERFSNTNICTISFCKDGDLLSQWRAYGNHGNGMALGFSGRKLRRAINTGRINLWKCLYDPSLHRQVTNDLIDLAERIYDFSEALPLKDTVKQEERKRTVGFFNTTFLQVAPVLKNEHFEEEQEWRLVSTSLPRSDSKYRAQISNQRVRQYYILDFAILNDIDAHPLKEIVIGPTRDQALLGNAISVFLFHHGYETLTRRYSLIPYRA